MAEWIELLLEQFTLCWGHILLERVWIILKYAYSLFNVSHILDCCRVWLFHHRTGVVNNYTNNAPIDAVNDQLMHHFIIFSDKGPPSQHIFLASHSVHYSGWLGICSKCTLQDCWVGGSHFTCSFTNVCNICVCIAIEKFKAGQETMALVESQQQSSSKMRSVFVDCQSGHHSHASLIKALTKIYNSVSGEVSLVLCRLSAQQEYLQLKILHARLCRCVRLNW